MHPIDKPEFLYPIKIPYRYFDAAATLNLLPFLSSYVLQ